MLNRAVPPSFVIPENFTIPVARQYPLANGNTLHSINSNEDALLKIDLFFPAGRIFQKQASVAALTIDMLFESTKNRTAIELAEAMDFFGAYTDYNVRAEWCSITLYTLNKHLESVLPFFIELLTLPAFKEEELQILIAREIQDLNVALEKNSVLAQYETSRRLWGTEHPWGMTPSEENYKSITGATIKGFFDQHYNIADAHIFVAGNIDEQVISVLSRALAIGKKSEHPLTKPAFAATETVGGDAFVLKSDSLQAALRLVRKHIPRSHPDYYDTQMLNLILGGYFGSRLMDNLREEKGYTYGIGSNISEYSNGSEWGIGTEVKNSVKDEAVIEIFNEMNRLKDELVEEEELSVARNYLLGQVLRSLDGPYNQLKYVEMIVLNGYSYDLVYKGFDRIKTIKPEDLKTVASKYFERKDWLTVVCGS
jgi:predicted Zn-dependent peptidase